MRNFLSGLIVVVTLAGAVGYAGQFYNSKGEPYSRRDTKKAAIELIGGMDGMVVLRGKAFSTQTNEMPVRVSSGSLVPMTEGSGHTTTRSGWRPVHPVA